MSDRYGEIRRASPAIAPAQDMSVPKTSVLSDHLRWNVDRDLGAPPKAEDWMACAVCRRTLESFRDAETGALVWDHTAMDVADGVTHRVVPVSYATLGIENVRMRCDFCGEHDPAFDVPVRDFSMQRNGHPWGSTSDWCACTECADLVSEGDWPRLTRRTVQAASQRSGIRDRLGIQVLAEDIEALHREVRRHQTGAPRLIRGITPYRAELDSAHRLSVFRRQP